MIWLSLMLILVFFYLSNLTLYLFIIAVSGNLITANYIIGFSLGYLLIVLCLFKMLPLLVLYWKQIQSIPWSFNNKQDFTLVKRETNELSIYMSQHVGRGGIILSSPLSSNISLIIDQSTRNSLESEHELQKFTEELQSILKPNHIVIRQLLLGSVFCYLLPFWALEKVIFRRWINSIYLVFLLPLVLLNSILDRAFPIVDKKLLTSGSAHLIKQYMLRADAQPYNLYKVASLKYLFNSLRLFTPSDLEALRIYQLKAFTDE